MNKELQDLAWNCLPKEFKEEVKDISHTCENNEVKAYLTFLFGYHNLTSDAEGEEKLIVNRKRVQEIYAQCEKIEMDDNPNLSANIIEAAGAKMELLDTLFGPKCLLDENSSSFERLENNGETEPKFKLGDIVRIKSNAAKYHQGYRNGYAWHPERDMFVGMITTITDIHKNGWIELKISGKNRYWSKIDLEPYTEQKEATNPFRVGDEVMFAEGNDNNFYTVEGIEGNNIIIDGGDVYHSDCFVLTEESKASLNTDHSDINIDELIDKGYVPDPSKLFDTISKERRLNIAAQMMQGLLAAPLTPGVDTNPPAEYLAQVALRLADALIAEGGLTEKLKRE